MSKSKKLPARYWAIGNRGGWGEGFTIADAVKRAVRGGWAGKTKSKLGEGDTISVWELDPAYPVTHIENDTGHALHRPEGSKPGPMGHYDADRHAYKMVDGKYIEPKRFRYQKGAHSDAGANLDRIDRSWPEAA